MDFLDKALEESWQESLEESLKKKTGGVPSEIPEEIPEGIRMRIPGAIVDGIIGDYFVEPLMQLLEHHEAILRESLRNTRIPKGICRKNTLEGIN